MGDASDILSQILGASNRAAILCGPAASGKTSAALAMYRHFTSADGAARCLLILPNSAAVAAARRSLMAAAGGTLVSPQVMTFAALRSACLGRRPRRRE